MKKRQIFMIIWGALTGFGLGATGLFFNDLAFWPWMLGIICFGLFIVEPLVAKLFYPKK